MRKKKSSKIIIITAVVLIVLIGTGIFLVKQYAKPYVRGKITEQLDSLSNSPWNLQYDSFSIDLSGGNFSITNLSIDHQADSSSRYKVSTDQLEITGIGIITYLLNKKISINNIHLSKPKIQLINKQQAKNKQDSSSTAKSRPKLPKMKIGKIAISDGQIQILHADSSLANPMLEAEFNFELTKLKTDSTEAHEYNFFDMETLLFDMKNIAYKPDSLYLINLKQLSLSLQDSSLMLDSASITSQYSKFDLGLAVGHEIDWMDISNQSIAIKHINFKEIFNDSTYHAGAITVNGLNALIFRDKRLPFPDKPNTELFKDFVAKLPVKVNIDTIMVKDARVEYQEYIKKAVGPGRVHFDNLYASFYHFTNTDSALLKKINYTAQMDAQCNVMGEGLLKASFKFPITDEGEPYSVTGSMEPMELSSINPMIEYVGFTKIREGKLLNLDFNFTYNNNSSDGKMYFEYENLKINTLDKDDHTSKGLGQNIKSFIANTFVVKTDNSKDDGKFRVGDISFERDKKKSIFNYWWKSLLTGFRSSTGIEAPEEKINVN
ncbi:hypothetical protein LVD15_24760 [Fulvivirga maritima]|uniref:hypothetical protein n=1 Tax=Fulvivirga maritima TaxID=2904247 RepID=UPI001F2E80C5|nr:hypothetical protein [Fulvivirga maritima]UII26469.1 hypothetical protein LVD15_24760 [Fulvivirga maritima]